MYCDKCHKKSPDNFVSCAYCGAKFESSKKKNPKKEPGKKKIKINFSLKNWITALVIFACVLILAATLTVIFTGSKPEKVVKNLVKATETVDGELYFSLFDNNIKKYKKDNRYFGDEETYVQIIQPMTESNAFYIEKCGENYRLSYNITSSEALSEDELTDFRNVLETGFDYVEFPSKVEILSVEIIAKGEKGTYKSVYNDFWCMKIKGRWYKVDKTVYNEYLNIDK